MWIIQNIVFSICLIGIIHYLCIYFKTIFSPSRDNNSITYSKHKYDTIFETIEKGNQELVDLEISTLSILPKSKNLGIPAEYTDGTNNNENNLQNNTNNTDNTDNTDKIYFM